MVARSPRQDEVWLVTLDPTRGAEIKKARPSLIVSHNEMNEHLRTAIVAPMTKTLRVYPTPVAVTFQGTSGQVALDELRAVDRERLVRKLGSHKTASLASAILVEMLAR